MVFASDHSDPTGFIEEEGTRGLETNAWISDLNRRDVVVAKGSVARVIFRLDDYYCGYVRITAHGGRGAKVRVTWAEAAFTDSVVASKSDRGSVSGKFFRGVWDEFHLAGVQHDLCPLAWRSGQFVEILVSAADEEVTIEGITILESRYPLEPVEIFSCDDAAINEIIPLCIRTLQACAHDHLVDCPYYEQLPYTGDGRLEALVNLTAFHDDALVRKMLTVFAKSIDLGGYTMASWPRSVRSVIPSFSLSWIGMIHDYAMHRRDHSLITSLLPCVRFLLDHVLRDRTGDGFFQGNPTAWNFIDWVDEWEQEECYHVPPGMDTSVNATYNWFVVYIFGLAERLEIYAGDKFMAARWRKVADDLAGKLKMRFWCPDRGLFKEDDSGDHYSQHAQVAAILSGYLEEPHLEALRCSLLQNDGLAACSIYWRHYLFEAFRILDRPEAIISGFGLWNQFVANGFRTAPETPENKTFNQRSDCHGWGSHPIYQLVSSVAGIRSDEMEFAKVLINPARVGLANFQATCVHPDGLIRVERCKTAECVRWVIDLPGAVAGKFRSGEFVRELHSGRQEFCFDDSAD